MGNISKKERNTQTAIKYLQHIVDGSGQYGKASFDKAFALVSEDFEIEVLPGTVNMPIPLLVNCSTSPDSPPVWGLLIKPSSCSNKPPGASPQKIFSPYSFYDPVKNTRNLLHASVVASQAREKHDGP